MDAFKETAQIHVVYDEVGYDADDNMRVHDLTGREYLQFMGTEAGRDTFWSSFWVDLVLPEPGLTEAGFETAMSARYPGVDCLTITDLRFPNEAERVKALGGVVWEVLRPGTGGDGHSSEKPLPRELVDYQIHNDGDLSVLRDRVGEAMDETLR